MNNKKTTREEDDNIGEQAYAVCINRMTEIVERYYTKENVRDDITDAISDGTKRFLNEMLEHDRDVFFDAIKASFETIQINVSVNVSKKEKTNEQ